MGTGERIWQAQTETETEPGIIAWVFRWRRWSGHALADWSNGAFAAGDVRPIRAFAAQGAGHWAQGTGKATDP